jgi:glutamate--cysteine ligase
MIWHATGRARDAAAPDGASPWLRAARDGPGDPRIAAASVACFEAAETALGRLGAPEGVHQAVTAFAERYVWRHRCPADDQLDQAHGRRCP